jgi:hypothetical protein
LGEFGKALGVESRRVKPAGVNVKMGTNSDRRKK